MNAPPASTPRLRTERHAAQASQDNGTIGKIRVLVVDDSLTVRTIFKRMVESDPTMQVVGTASSAERALAQLRTLRVDVVLLDLEMPGIGGLEALPSLLETAPDAEVLVVSSLAADGAEHSVTALSMGAADTMLKPRPGGFTEDYRSQLLRKIGALGGRETSDQDKTSPVLSAVKRQIMSGKAPKVVAIGASTGGIHALNLLLCALPDEFDLPILITQHLPSSFIQVFARQIETASGRRTRMAEDGTEVHCGEIVVATGHGHMVVHRVGERLVTRTSARPARSGCMPSVDPMLSSLSQTCDGNVLAIILSGMGRDGLVGARELSDRGGTIFAQSVETSAVWGMPGAVVKAGLTSMVGSPDELGNAAARCVLALPSIRD